ncbi:YaiI/YqxD family protein [uncultured Clostridium sp.]|uniref:YaiI/YqxD family protein n=1 Tax=uncultured Clostridium sp. TaxID=59620 RepID=UPI00260C0383|nr:YaiI/YqxD family protein [uncultured Clostridium sp.]
MKIIIDGDACPSISKIELKAQEYGVDVKIFCDINHCITSDYAKVSVVDSGFQNVDMYVINEAKENDIIVTQDFGVAALCLPKGAKCINPNGKIYTNENIDMLLEKRHMSQKVRAAGGRMKGQKKRKSIDERLFLEKLESLIKLAVQK